MAAALDAPARYGEIMELLVRKWLPDSVKKASGLEEEELVCLARFLGWGHDLGKAILTFQSMIMQCLPEAKQRLERLTPLDCPVQNRKQSPHARASEAILQRIGVPCRNRFGRGCPSW